MEAMALFVRGHVAVPLLTLLLACAQGNDAGTGGAALGGEGPGGGGSTPQAVGCSANDPCPPGRTCHNGACAKGCNGDADCEEDVEYCALALGQICQPREAPACPAVACADTQSCVNGLCGTQTGTPCGPNPFSDADGCPADEICLDQVSVDGFLVSAKQCYTFPACSPDYTCPVGVGGAICSFGVFPDKQAFCLPGMCLGDENCPAAFHCVRKGAGEAAGHCTDGAQGSLCLNTSDCAGSPCVIATPGQLGTCQ